MKNLIIAITICFLFGKITYGQKLTVNEAHKLAKDLNSTISDSTYLHLEENKAFLKFHKLDKKLDLRTKLAIAQDSMPKKEIKEKYYHSGRYIGDIFWQYDFKSSISTKTSFKANNSGKIFFTLKYKENDTILIKSKLNEYTSHHRLYDSRAHEVQWSGDKYISVLLQVEKENDVITFFVRGLTLSGKFERKDKNPLNKNYNKTLRGILKREFQKKFSEVVLDLKI